MTELGQLEQHHQEFEKRNIRIFVISNDDQPTSRITQGDFPHLTVVADTNQNLAKALQVIHPGMAADGTDTNAPTTFFVDGTGNVRWLFRPESFVVRLSPEELLEAIDKN